MNVSLPTLRALSYLNERDREVIVDHYFVGHTLADIAARLGISKSRVSTLEQRGLKKLSSLLQRT